MASSEEKWAWPLSLGWSVALGVFTLGFGLLFPFAIFLHRKGHTRAGYVAAGIGALLVLLIGIGMATSSDDTGSPNASARPTPAPEASAGTAIAAKPTKTAPRKCSSYTGAKKPQTCVSKSGSACDTYAYLSKPHDCFTPPQWRERERVRKDKAARVAAYRKAQAEREAARQQAIAAANAWHQGYNQQDANVYWKWVRGDCQDYAQDGCWHVEVITRDGCPSYVAVNANEYAGDTIINSLLDNQGYGIPPKTQRIFELDGDPDGDSAGDVTVDCQ